MSVTHILIHDKRKPNPYNSSKVISFKASKELDELLSDISRILGLNKSEVIRLAILKLIKTDERLRELLAKKYIQYLEAMLGGRGASIPQTRTSKSDSNHYMRNTTSNIEHDVYSKPSVETIKIVTY